MSSDPVDDAVQLLQARFPDLAEAVMPSFEKNARKAVTNLGVEALHGKRLSLFTALDARLWGNMGQILQTLDQQVVQLSSVPGVDGVCRRLAECGRGTLLSTISEMALAVHLMSCGAEISFDVEYVLLQDGNATNRDVDILATWPWGSAALEVYSPVKASENTKAGWISLKPKGLADVIAGKASKKFGRVGASCQGLPDGVVKVLAVDLAYNDVAFLGVASQLGRLQEEVESKDVLAGADAAVLFVHDQFSPGHPVAPAGIVKRGSIGALTAHLAGSEGPPT